jgi:mannose-6-phosphate isomerase-like protein (cupin superfamily)
MKATVADTLPRIPGPPNDVWPNGVRSAVAMEHGSMQLRLFAPGERDLQQPHIRDEIYVVIEGSGEFVIEHADRIERIAFALNDVLFVAAGVRHRFENFTPEFKTWVVFYGPEGGET